MRQMIAAANWKMNGRADEVKSFAAALNQVNTDARVIFAPPTPYLTLAAESITATHISTAAQTASEYQDGAFTGETSMAMLNDVGCRHVIVGHSERRAIYGETDEMIFAKTTATFAAGLTPILCIGETDAENQAQQTEQVLAKQLALAINGLTQTQKQQIIIAYEPVWAIGTGRTPSVDDIQAIHQKIRYLFSANDDTISASVRILYGGSVKPDNAAAIFACADVDGGLVGGASLTIESFEKIIKAL